MTWTDGYITDIAYPGFFYKEMQPLWLATTATVRGFSAPEVAGAFEACELGCGTATNLLVAAACHPHARFTGVDFNEAHLAIARKAADACGLRNVTFVHADFAAFGRANTRQFDFVTSHGVWSWVAPRQRAALMDCAARSLKPRGLLYLHYMCHPGSTTILPLQHMMNLAAHHMPGDLRRKAQTGLKLLEQLAALDALAGHPAMRRHLANMARRDPADLAHEFLSDHWEPQHSVDVHQQASDAGLHLIGSADAFDNLDVSLSIPGKLQPLIRKTTVPALAEALKDMARGAHQRMDLFQKSPVPLAREALLTTVGGIAFRLLPGAPARGPITFRTPIGPITGPAAVFTPLLERLARRAATVAELMRLPSFGDDPGGLLQSLQLLMMGQIAHPALPGDVDGAAAALLARWYERNGIALTLVDACGTAVVPAGPA
ncbi:methyltransferase domain-containing protein [Sphingomonas hankookensis]|uniref:methyltransferase domain-containing protein n=1 Tax=Sphingomonas hankookensis TaxID=563996 RepID=UPI003F7B32B8